MATAEEDFTFPATTTDPPPRFIDSPPLWRPSPSAATHLQNPEKFKGKQVQDEDKINLCSFQEFKASSVNKRKSPSHDGNEEEKMDMLWEDLNDEFSRSGKMVQNSDVSSPGRDVQISCVKSLKLSKANGHMLSGKKPSVLLFIKVLKRVFLLHNSHRTIKKCTW